MVSNFAKNLQFHSKLKKPTSIANRNERVEIGKKALMHSPSQFEERKRSNSVLSSGSIISTASSNSHKRKAKGVKDPSSLQVAGMKLGSNRKGYIPSKYDRSPFLNLALGGQSGAPTKQQSDFLSGGKGISLSGVEPPSKGRSSGSDIIGGVPLSIAARKKEMQA